MARERSMSAATTPAESALSSISSNVASLGSVLATQHTPCVALRAMFNPSVTVDR